MQIKQKLQLIRDYIAINRRVGHTTAMIRGAQNVDNVLVIAANQHNAAMLRRDLPRAEVVAITNPVCMVGKSKAMVMDNHALWEIASAALAEIDSLEKQLAELIKNQPK